MKPFEFAVLALSLAAAACGGSGTNAQNKQSGSATDATANAAAYSAAGTVTTITGDQVSISHGPVEGLGWPAMTMTFRAQSPQQLQGISAGDRVAFQFRESAGSHLLTSISKQ